MYTLKQGFAPKTFQEVQVIAEIYNRGCVNCLNAVESTMSGTEWLNKTLTEHISVPPVQECCWILYPEYEKMKRNETSWDLFLKGLLKDKHAQGKVFINMHRGI